MDIQITFHQMDSSEAIKDYCHKKLDKLTKYYSRIDSVKVVLEIVKLEHHVSVIIGLPQKTVVKGQAHAKQDMYAAIDAVADKLERQLTDYKERH
jgi:putative sigma-54 modulation protein